MTRLLPRPRTVVWPLLVAGLVVYLTCLAAGLGRGDGPTARLIGDWLQNVLLAGGGLVAWRRARALSADRLAWLVLAVALLLWSLGQIVWMLVYRDVAEPPYPSWSDALWLACYPIYYACLVLLVRPQIPRFQSSWWLDGLCAALAATAAATAVLYGPVQAQTGGTTAVVVTTLAYPVADVILIAMVAGVFALSGLRPGRAWTLVLTGVALNALADSLYTLEAAAGVYEEGTLLDGVWVCSALMLARAVGADTRGRASLRMSGWRTLATPTVTALLAMGLLAYDQFHPTNRLATMVALLTLVAVMVRVSLTFRENLALAETRRQARTDELTGLGNRRSLYAATDEALDAGDAALLLIDLDRFKELNDTLGHHAGDALLCHVADRLTAAVPEARHIARLGGDEFVVLLAGAVAADALEVGAQIRDALRRPLEIDGLLAHVDASIGVAAGPAHGADRSDLLRHADIAMYRAKHQNTGIEVYADELNLHTRDRLALVGDLRHAIADDQLEIHFQPKADLATGEVVGVEALVRWRHPERGLLFPDAFLPLCEEYGLMRELTLAVMGGALEQHAAWLREGIELRVSVNVSPANLLDVRFPDDVAGRLAAHGLGPGALQIELTEQTVMVDPVRALDVLARLGELGVALSLDDFGTGYSSLAYLKRLPVTELKIDRSFVMNMTSDLSDATIVRSTADLARNLGLHVVAEGVETAEHWEMLRAFGCHTAQGYHLSRPLPAAELGAWLRDARERLAAGARLSA